MGLLIVLNITVQMTQLKMTKICSNIFTRRHDQKFCHFRRSIFYFIKLFQYFNKFFEVSKPIGYACKIFHSKNEKNTSRSSNEVVAFKIQSKMLFSAWVLTYFFFLLNLKRNAQSLNVIKYYTAPEPLLVLFFSIEPKLVLV